MKLKIRISPTLKGGGFSVSFSADCIISPPVPPFRVGEKNRRRKRSVSFAIEYCFMNSTGREK
jgi:hypothetical protein